MRLPCMGGGGGREKEWDGCMVAYRRGICSGEVGGGGTLSSHLLVVYPVSRPALTMAVLKPRAAVKVSIGV